MADVAVKTFEFRIAAVYAPMVLQLGSFLDASTGTVLVRN